MKQTTLFGVEVLSVLVISGSRDLQGSKWEDLARGKLVSGIQYFFRDKDPHDPRHLIFVGDAKEGPDSWVEPIVRKSHHSLWIFEGLTGVIRMPSGNGRWISDESLRRLDTRSRYLARNRQMNSIAAAAGDEVQLIALEHMGSKTKGTANTITAAEAVGIGVWHLKYGEPEKG